MTLNDHQGYLECTMDYVVQCYHGDENNNLQVHGFVYFNFDDNVNTEKFTNAHRLSY